MKLILCSVFLAHGAVVYTVCAPITGGLYLTSKEDCSCTLNIILDKSEASDRGPIDCTEVKTKKKSQAINNIKCEQRNRSSIASCTLAEDDKSSRGRINGWQMNGDLSLKTDRNSTIYFTIDARGNIKNIAITPFTSVVYKEVCNQLKQIHFLWRGTSIPPAYTTFKKEICII